VNVDPEEARLKHDLELCERIIDRLVRQRNTRGAVAAMLRARRVAYDRLEAYHLRHPPPMPG
jgi:hypothetical protein